MKIYNGFEFKMTLLALKNKIKILMQTAEYLKLISLTLTHLI